MGFMPLKWKPYKNINEDDETKIYDIDNINSKKLHVALDTGGY